LRFLGWLARPGVYHAVMASPGTWAGGGRRLRAAALCLPLLAPLMACRTAAPPPPVAPPPAPKPPPPPPGMQIQKLREELQVAPWELAFSGVRGEATASETVVVRNLVDHQVDVRAIRVVGDAAAQFSLPGLPALPAPVIARGTLSLDLVWKPPADATVGVQRATLRIQVGDELDDGPASDLTTLVQAGRAPEQEPSLQEITDALGFSVDVGGRSLDLPVTDAPIGAGVPLSLFTRARAGQVAVNPVARYSPDEALPFGYFVRRGAGRRARPELRPLGVLAAGRHQTLNPELEPEGQTSFDPGDEAFGVWIKPGNQAVLSDAHENRGRARRGIRLYPLRARNGAAIGSAYLLAIAGAGRGDFQDAVFVIWNVTLAAPADGKLVQSPPRR
jgi:hypothetical protein